MQSFCMWTCSNTSIELDRRDHHITVLLLVLHCKLQSPLKDFVEFAQYLTPEKSWGRSKAKHIMVTSIPVALTFGFRKQALSLCDTDSLSFTSYILTYMYVVDSSTKTIYIGIIWKHTHMHACTHTHTHTHTQRVKGKESLSWQRHHLHIKVFLF